MVATHPGMGSDLNGDGEISVGLSPKGPAGLPAIEGMTAEQVGQYFGDSGSMTVKVGRTTQTHELAQQFSWSTTQELPTPMVSSPDGHDTVFGFAGGQDTLVLQLSDGLALADVKAMLQVSLIDTNDDLVEDATHIAFAQAPDVWSVTLVGVTNFSMDSIVAA